MLEKNISLIGIDCSGIRYGAEHREADQRCDDKDTFVVENMCNFKTILNGAKVVTFLAHTYPINHVGNGGVPCRVIAETK